MRQRAIWLSSVAVGAAAAFLLDPASGKRRRHRLADASVHLVNRGRRAVFTVERDLRNRMLGLIAGTRKRFESARPDDVVLEERVHSALGRVLSHPHAITVVADQGRVTLDGKI